MVKLAFLKLAGRIAQGLLLAVVPAALAMAVAESVIRPRPSCFLVAKFRPGVTIPGCEEADQALGSLQNQQAQLDARMAEATGRPRVQLVEAATEAAKYAEDRQWRERRERTSVTTESVVSSAWMVSAARALAAVMGLLALVALVISFVPMEGLPRALLALGSLMVLVGAFWLASDRWMRPPLQCYVNPDVLRTMEPRTTCTVESGELERRWRKLVRDLPIVEREVQRLEQDFSVRMADQAAEASLRRERTEIGEPEELRLLRERAVDMRIARQQLVDEIWYRSIPYPAIAWGSIAYGIVFVFVGLGVGVWRQHREASVLPP